MATMTSLLRRSAIATRGPGAWTRAGFLTSSVAVAGFTASTRSVFLKPSSRAAGAIRARGGGSMPDAVRETLVLLWEASDRICGKRLKCLLSALVEVHGAPRPYPPR